MDLTRSDLCDVLLRMNKMIPDMEYFGGILDDVLYNCVLCEISLMDGISSWCGLTTISLKLLLGISEPLGPVDFEDESGTPSGLVRKYHFLEIQVYGTANHSFTILEFDGDTYLVDSYFGRYPPRITRVDLDVFESQLKLIGLRDSDAFVSMFGVECEPYHVTLTPPQFPVDTRVLDKFINKKYN